MNSVWFLSELTLASTPRRAVPGPGGWALTAHVA
jgi:hypothetical protein